MTLFRTTIRIPLVASMLAIAMFGCAGPRQATREIPAAQAPGRDFLGELRQSYQSTPSLSISGTLKATGQPITIWLDAIIRRRDSLKILLTGPFGISIGAMSATDSRFLFFNTAAAEAMEGVPDRETFSQILMVDLDYQEMISLLRGEVPHIPSAGSYTLHTDGDLLTYRVEGEGMREEFSLDSSDLSIRSYNRWTVRPDTVLPEIAIAYSSFTNLDGRRFPRQAMVDVRGGAQRIQISLDKISDVIAADRTFAIDIPAGIPRKKI